MAVGSRCIHVAPGVGAIVTQASTNPRLGHLGLNLLRAGHSAPRVLDEIAASDQFVERRQLGCLDVSGLGAGRTGAGNRPWAGHRVDRNVVVAANAVVGEKVADAASPPQQHSRTTTVSRSMLKASRTLVSTPRLVAPPPITTAFRRSRRKSSATPVP